MSKSYEHYRIYRALLHLYPKPHRVAYGHQMVQTLDDILSEAQTGLERFTVWLRISFELPINIIEENLNSMGETSVSKLTKITNRQLVYVVVAVLLIGSYAATALIWRHQRAEISSLNNTVQILSENQATTSGGGYSAVTISPSENSVYLPLVNLKLTDSNLNEGLVYTYQPAHTVQGIKKVFPAQLDISTHELAVNDFSTSQQFDCSQVTYADFVTPSYPVNPMWKLDGTIKLADGRTMNIYYAPSIPGCNQAWQVNNINSKAIADSLRQAVSY